jgi:hypothetical protein
VVRRRNIVLLKSGDCGWCGDAERLFAELDVTYAAADIEENKIAKAVSKKLCGGEPACLVIDGKPLKRVSRAKLADELLD